MITICYGQEPDSLLLDHSPKKAALYALLFPGGGQVYNGRYGKAVMIVGLEVLASWRFSVNRNNFRNYNDGYPLPRHRYLEKRNKYAWWVGFIYIYGLLDAVVDAHLQSFDAVMSEDLEKPPPEEDKTQDQ